MDRSKDEIGQLIARRFPRTELLELVEEYASSVRAEAKGRTELDCSAQHAPGHVERDTCHMRRRMLQPRPAAEIGAARGRSLRALHVVLCQEAHDLIRYAQALSSHSNPQGNISQVLLHALRDHVAQLEKQKFAATRATAPTERERDRRHPGPR